MKRVSLEMGGKNGIIVMDDADLDLVVDGALWGAFGTIGPALHRVVAADRPPCSSGRAGREAGGTG